MTTDNPTAITLRFTIGETPYVVRSGRITGLMSRELRDPERGVGVGFGAMLDRILGSHDIDADYVAALIWLARVQAGETRLPLVRVLETTTFDDVARFTAHRDDSPDDGTALGLEPGTAPDERGDDSPL